MKSALKLSLTLFVLTTSTIFAQSGQKWGTGGNGTTSGDFLGTTNNQPLIFKTNNTQVGMFNIDGSLNLSSLNNGTKGLVLYDGNGTLFQLPFTQNSNQMLLGDGTWGNIPNTSNLWLETNGNISYTHGYVGVGTAFPVFPLDVIGDARISNNLYVGGGVVITDKVRATGDVKTGRLEADTIKMDSGKMLYGETKIEGDAKLKYKLDVTGISNFNDEVYLNRSAVVNNDFTVGGNANLNGNVRLQNGFTFDGINGVTFINDGTNQIVRYGNKTLSPATFPCAAGPLSTSFTQQFGGALQIFDNSNPTTSGLLNLQTWTGGSSIDASVGGQTGQGGLLLNYFCGNNTAINTGPNGGTVSMGKRVEIGMPYPPNQNTALNIKGDVDFSGINLITNHTTDFNYNTALTVNRDAAKAIGIFNFNGSTATEKFIIWGTGRTDINASTKTDKYFVVKDVSVSGSPVESFAVSGNGYTQINVSNPAAMDNVFDITDLSNIGNNGKYLFRVKSNGHVFAREVEIRNTSLAFPDYVFAKDYKLLPLEEVESYINNNKHLPGFEKAEYYETNGIKSTEMFVKQQEKIEELTLYIIELEKRLKALENSNKH